MNLLNKKQLEYVLSQFQIPEKLIFLFWVKIETDYYMYVFEDKNEQRYALLNRDYFPDIEGLEDRVLNDLYGIDLGEFIKPVNNNKNTQDIGFLKFEVDLEEYFNFPYKFFLRKFSGVLPGENALKNKQAELV